MWETSANQSDFRMNGPESCSGVVVFPHAWSGQINTESCIHTIRNAWLIIWLFGGPACIHGLLFTSGLASFSLVGIQPGWLVGSVILYGLGYMHCANVAIEPLQNTEPLKSWWEAEVMLICFTRIHMYSGISIWDCGQIYSGIQGLLLRPQQCWQKPVLLSALASLKRTSFNAPSITILFSI